jgi:hypothetical protein
MEYFGLVLTDIPNADWARSILLTCYGVLILYLVGIEVFKYKIIRSRHRSFWELHLASLPIVAVFGLMYKLYNSLLPNGHVGLFLSMMLHFLLMLILIVGCIIEKSRREKLNDPSF